MNAFKVIFADPQYNYVTEMNATLEEARAYFIGQSFNKGDREWGEGDNLQKPIAVELCEDEYEGSFEDEDRIGLGQD